MNKKVIFILVGGLLILALIFILWFWFFGRHDKTDILPGDSFGSASSTGSGANSGNTGGNGQAPFGSNTSGSSGSEVTNPGYSYISSTTQSGISYQSYNGFTTPSGVFWFDGTAFGSTTVSTGGGTGSGFNFTQTPINNINTGSISGSPYIETTVKGADGTDISLLSGIATVIGGCLLQYGLQQAVVAPATTAIDTGIGAAGNFLAGLFGLNISGSTPLNPQYVSDVSSQGRISTETVSQCLTRTLGRLAVQKITDSTVAWINSGFDGQPAYVQDFNKFFTDVADEAAGAYIQSSDFAFLCSPFKLQVKIAVAQSYARRSSAPSCTLTNVVGNVESFMKGNFSEGGWQGLISYTTIPTNNAYGAFITLQAGLDSSVGNAQANANLDLTLGQGFLSVKDKNGKITTPGRALVSSFDATTQSTLDSLQMGDSIDQILGALSNALITKLLYNGLSNVNNASAASNPATTKAQALMQGIQAGVSTAQQYASIKQRTISDMQNSQRRLATLANCWSLATSSNLSPDKIAQATTGFDEAVAEITSLQTQVTQHNNSITAANNSIVHLQALQTDLLLATVASDVNSVEAAFNTIKTSGNPRLYTQSDITSASQDRAAVQNSLAQQDTLATAKLQQCYALGN